MPSKLDEIRVDYWEEANLRGQETILTCQEVDYHRNGVGGEGFHVVKFHDSANGPMVGILFALDLCEICGSYPDESRSAPTDHMHANSNGRVAVFNRDLIAEDNYKFMVNSWRGDVFEPFLRRCIQEYRKAFDKALKGE